MSFYTQVSHESISLQSKVTLLPPLEQTGVERVSERSPELQREDAEDEGVHIRASPATWYYAFCWDEVKYHLFYLEDDGIHLPTGYHHFLYFSSPGVMITSSAVVGSVTAAKIGSAGGKHAAASHSRQKYCKMQMMTLELNAQEEMCPFQCAWCNFDRT